MRTFTAFDIFPADTTTPTLCDDMNSRTIGTAGFAILSILMCRPPVEGNRGVWRSRVKARGALGALQLVLIYAEVTYGERVYSGGELDAWESDMGYFCQF